MNDSIEVWKPIKGYEFYEVSNLGRVKSLERFVKKKFGERIVVKKIIKQSEDGAGYYQVVIYRNNSKKTFRVHRLVADAFIENHDNKRCVNHKDGNKKNNFWKNLEWATHKENSQHAWMNGLKNTDHLERKVAQIKDGKVVRVWKSQSEVDRRLNIKQGNISKCCLGKRIIAGGFQWRFT